MSSDDEEEEDYAVYGTPLEDIDEANIPRKKPVSVEEQYVKDEHGRRRFHGAFSGGFSAGFHNSVGSLEGWAPSSFKSSRSQKAEKKSMVPTDFMDEEDKGEFGICPMNIRVQKDYDTSTSGIKRKKNETDIESSLCSILQPVRETIGVKILASMGWKPGQGIGPRVRVRERIKELGNENVKIYGCCLPTGNDLVMDFSEITFAPSDFEKFLIQPKKDTHGIGYTGMDRKSVLSDKKGISELNVGGRSIFGQAFGIGIDEDDDDIEVYSKEDRSQYDFELGGKSKKKIARDASNLDDCCVAGFHISTKSPKLVDEYFPKVVVPADFVPNVRKSRFDRSDRDQKYSRLTSTAAERSKIVNNEKTTQSATTPLAKIKKFHFACGEISDRFTSGTIKEDVGNILQATKPTNDDTDCKEAAKIKMFGFLTRQKFSWIPDKLLCKRFNIPVPAPSNLTLLSQSLSRSSLISTVRRFNSTKITVTEEPSSSWKNSVKLPTPHFLKEKKSSLEKINFNDESYKIEQRGSSKVGNRQSTKVDNRKLSKVDNRESSKVDSRDASEVYNCQSSKVDNRDLSKVYNRESSKDDYRESSKVDNCEASMVDNDELTKYGDDVDSSLNLLEGVNLFKAIFLSSSEDEEEDENVIDDSANVKKRDASTPPRGIFSNFFGASSELLDQSKINPSIEQKNSESQTNCFNTSEIKELKDTPRSIGNIYPIEAAISISENVKNIDTKSNDNCPHVFVPRSKRLVEETGIADIEKHAHVFSPKSNRLSKDLEIIDAGTKNIANQAHIFTPKSKRLVEDLKNLDTEIKNTANPLHVFLPKSKRLADDSENTEDRAHVFTLKSKKLTEGKLGETASAEESRNINSHKLLEDSKDKSHSAAKNDSTEKSPITLQKLNAEVYGPSFLPPSHFESHHYLSSVSTSNKSGKEEDCWVEKDKKRKKHKKHKDHKEHKKHKKMKRRH